MATSKRPMIVRLVGNGINALHFIAPKQAANIALQLFCKPRKGRIRDIDQQFLSTAQDHQALNTKHGKIQTYFWNQSGQETVLLAHGWESNAARWSELVPVLIEANYRIVAVDAPAHGASEGLYFTALKYAEILRQLYQTHPFDYGVAHSIGGFALTYYLAQMANNPIKGQILLGAPSSLPRIFEEYYNFLGYTNGVRNSLEKLFLDQFNNPSSYFIIPNFGQSVSAPTLIIHDRYDSIIPIHESEDYHRTLPDAQLKQTEGYGHRLKSPVVYEEILSFLNKLP